MIKRVLLLTFILLFAPAVPALAGGWAVITLNELPGEITAGESITIGFTVRQHGTRLMDGLDPTIRASNTETGEGFTVDAKPSGESGRYFASLTFPSGGRWEWSIQAFSMDQAMPPLDVRAAAQSAFQQPAAPRSLSISAPLLIGLLGLTGAASALLVWLRRRVRWALAAIPAGILVAVMAFASNATGQPEVNSPGTSIQAMQDSSIGADLFVAKGCTTCHAHASIERGKNTIYADVGRDLTNFSADPVYLRSWLREPTSVKPETEMPDLELSANEIEALVEFLNTK